MTTAICMVIFYCRFHLLFPMFQKYHDFFTNSLDKSHLSYVKWFFTVFHTYCFLWFLHEHSYAKPYHADHCHHLCDDYHSDHRHHLYGDYHADHRHHLYGDSLLYVTPIFSTFQTYHDFFTNIPTTNSITLMLQSSVWWFSAVHHAYLFFISAIICVVILYCTSPSVWWFSTVWLSHWSPPSSIWWLSRWSLPSSVWWFSTVCHAYFFFISDIPRLLRKHSYGKLYTQIAAVICIVILCCTSCLFVLHFRHNLFGDFILYITICDSLLYVTLIFSSFQTYNNFFTNIPMTNSITLIAAIICMVILCCTSCLFLLHFRHDLCVDFILYITICMVILYCMSHLFFFFSDIPWFLHKHSYHQPYHPDHCYHLYGDSILYVTLHQSKPKTQTKDVHACTHRANCGKLYSSLYKFKRWDASWQNQQNECAHSEDSDQTGRMPRLIWVFAGRITTLLVLSCRGSNWDAWNNYCNLTNIWTVLVGCSWMWKMQKER